MVEPAVVCNMSHQAIRMMAWVVFSLKFYLAFFCPTANSESILLSSKFSMKSNLEQCHISHAFLLSLVLLCNLTTKL